MSLIASQHFSFAELQRHPQIMVDLLERKKDAAFIVQRDGDDITIAAYPAYSEEVEQILQDARVEYQRLKQYGYEREQAIEDFRTSQIEISYNF